MTATLHVYEKNALTALARLGLSDRERSYTESSAPNTYNPLPGGDTPYFVVCCNTTSSVFNSTFDKPLKSSATVNGATVQTGLLDNGPVALQYPANLNASYFYDLRFLNSYSSALLGSIITYTFSYRSWVDEDGTTIAKYLATFGSSANNFPNSVGNLEPGPVKNTSLLLSGVRSVLLCANFGNATYNTQTLFQQSYALCMIDLGQTYGAANGTALTTNLQWTNNTIMRLQKTGP